MNTKIALYRINQGIKVSYSFIRRNLLWITVFLTEKCNSRCKTCLIWAKKDPLDMPLNLFKDIINSITKKTYINITGGEALLHPKINEILRYLYDQNRPYTLFSNGILSDTLIATCREFNIKSLTMSCDGPKETYKCIRGIDNYDNVVKIVRALKGKTNIAIDYTISPLNRREDLVKVKDFCDKEKIHLSIGSYDNLDYFDTVMPKQKLYDVDGLATYPVDKFIRLYNKWFDGKIKLPCYSTRFSCTILPSGSVLMCAAKKIVLGNLNELPLKKIWDSGKTREIQEKYEHCNGCWILCQRAYDVGLITMMKHFIPRRVLNSVLGDYDWDKI